MLHDFWILQQLNQEYRDRLLKEVEREQFAHEVRNHQNVRPRRRLLTKLRAGMDELE